MDPQKVFEISILVEIDQIPSRGWSLVSLAMVTQVATFGVLAAGLALSSRAPVIVVDCTDRTGRPYDGIGGLSNRCD
jgi:hypothetical protein